MTSRLLISLRAPSVVCTSDTALDEFSMAVWRPAIWARCCSEMTRAAGPSAPRLIFKPEESRSSDLARLLEVRDRLCCAVSEATLFVMTKAMTQFPWK